MSLFFLDLVPWLALWLAGWVVGLIWTWELGVAFWL